MDDLIENWFNDEYESGYLNLEDNDDSPDNNDTNPLQDFNDALNFLDHLQDEIPTNNDSNIKKNLVNFLWPILTPKYHSSGK